MLCYCVVRAGHVRQIPVETRILASLLLLTSLHLPSLLLPSFLLPLPSSPPPFFSPLPSSPPSLLLPLPSSLPPFFLSLPFFSPSLFSLPPFFLSLPFFFLFSLPFSPPTKSTSTTKEDYGLPGITILYLREYRKRHTQRSSKKRKKWTGWKPITEEQTVKFKKEVMINNDGVEEYLAIFQNNTDNSARKVERKQKEKQK